MNRYAAIGNLTKDPVCRDAGESKVCNFSIAINEYHYSGGNKTQSTFYIDIECWNRQAENCTKFLSKGNKVAIEGKLKTNSWEKNGQKITKFICIADRVHFLASDEKQVSEKKLDEDEEKLENSSKENDNTEDLHDIDDIPF